MKNSVSGRTAWLISVGAAALAAALLRRWQLASAYLPETGLFVHGAPATFALLGLTGLLALVCLLLTRVSGPAPEDFLPAFSGPQAGHMAVWAAAWILMTAAGGFGMQEGFRGLRQWRALPGSFSPRLARRLRREMEVYQRLPEQNP